MTRGGSPRDEATMAYHRKVITEGYLLAGRSQLEMARELGVSQQQVSQDVKWLKAQWRREAETLISAVKAEELRRISLVFFEASAAWERSKADQTTHRTERASSEIPWADAGTGAPTLTLQRQRSASQRRQRDGDPRYLKIMMQCIEMRLKVMGALPEHHEVSGPGGGPIEVSAVSTPGLSTLATRLLEGLKHMRPEERTVMLQRYRTFLFEADYLNQHLLGLPPALAPDAELAEAASERISAELPGFDRPPSSVRVVGGAVVYDEEEEGE